LFCGTRAGGIKYSGRDVVNPSIVNVSASDTATVLSQAFVVSSPKGIAAALATKRVLVGAKRERNRSQARHLARISDKVRGRLSALLFSEFLTQDIGCLLPVGAGGP